ncbi:PrgI family protein [uncultured archaeon]|nr:PrgI family protein [uncultured archaeon]
MPYAIPKNIRYEEKLLGPLTVKQTAYVGVGASIAGYIYMMSGLQDEIKTAAVLVVGLLTIGFAMFNLDTLLRTYVGFMRATKKSSWISPAARELLNIQSIRADAVYLKDKRILGLLKVRPINFGVLSAHDQDTVIYGFLEFLNSLNFSIQITMRSVNLDLEDYLRHLKRRIVHRDDKVALAYYEHFAEYMRTYIKVNRINDRHFYVVVPAAKGKDEKTTVLDLEKRCELISATLGLSGIVSERMDTHALINFYSSYFTETFEIFESYISPITLYRKMWKQAPKHVLNQAGPGVSPTAPAQQPQAKPPE